MENKKNKRKLFKRIGAIVCAVAVAVVAFVVPFSAKNSPKINSKNMTASADELVSTYYTSNTWQVGYTYGAFSVSGSFNTGTNLNSPFSFILQNTPSGLSVTVNRYSNLYSVQTLEYSHTFLASPGGVIARMPYSSTSLLEIQVFLTLSSTNFLVSDIVYCDLSVEQPTDSLWVTTFFWCDSAGNSFAFQFCTFTSGTNYLGYFIPYNARVYLPNSLTADYNDGYRMGYSEGYTSGENMGYTNGYSAGESDGYSSGYNAGETIGYNNGYSQGLESGGNYSFFSLISAVIDAPIQAFMGLFNFELLGINLAGFFTGLLTLAFIITIVRLVMP